MKLTDSINRKLGAILSILNMGVSLVVGLVYTPICTHYLGQSEYGLITFASSLIGYLSILDMGFGSALIRYCNRLRERNEDESNLFGFFLILFLVIALIALVAGIGMYLNLETVFSSGFSNEEIAILKPIFLLLLVNVVLSFPGGVFASIINSYEKFFFLRACSILKSIFMHLTNIAVLFFGFRSVTVTAVTVAYSIIIYAINIYYCFNKLHIKFGFKRFEKEFYKDILSYSFFIFIGMIASQLYDETDKVILGKFAGSEAVAVYGVGVTFYVYFKMMALSVTNVFFPLIAKLSVKNDSIGQMSLLFNKIGRILTIALGFILIGFVCFGKEFTILWVGADYLDSYWIALLIMGPALIPWAQSLGTSILEAINKHKVNSIMYFVVAILNVILSIPLSIKYGGIGAAIGTAIGTILGRCIYLNYYYKVKVGIDIETFWKEFIKIAIRFIPVYVIFSCSNLFIINISWFNLIIKIGISCILVIPYVYFVVLNQSEKNLFNSWVKRLTKVYI